MIDKSNLYKDYAQGRISTFPKGFLGGMNTLYITSEFGYRINPNNQQKTFHYGVDIRCKSGTMIHAPARTYIQNIKTLKGGGLTLFTAVEGSFAPGHTTYVVYMHLSRIANGIKVGKWIGKNQVIAYTGGDPKDKETAGCSTGPHLHLQIEMEQLITTNSVNPEIFLSQHHLTYCSGGFFVGNEDYKWFNLSGIQYKAESTDLLKSNVESETDYEYIKPKPLQSVSKRFAPGIWQITKLVVDGSVEGRQVCNTGVATSTGSLINFFNTVCQQHLVEFSGDTFGNQYYWMVRRPPFDHKGWERMKQLTMITVEEKNIVNMNLSWSTQDIYSWYQYIPYYEMYGARDITHVMPAVFFPEYAQIWGSKPLAVQSNYYSYIASGYYGSQNKEANKSNGNEIAKNAIRDLAYLIESNAYNPFTRSGSITIMGDRRIKRGTLVYLQSTDEVFYVDSVSNSYSVTANGCERTTTLQVIKGMRENPPLKHYDYYNIKEANPYFDLIMWGYESVEKMIDAVTANNMKEIVSKWHVNRDAFFYFMGRRQMIGLQEEK